MKQGAPTYHKKLVRLYKIHIPVLFLLIIMEKLEYKIFHIKNYLLIISNKGICDDLFDRTGASIVCQSLFGTNEVISVTDN